MKDHWRTKIKKVTKVVLLYEKEKNNTDDIAKVTKSLDLISSDLKYLA